MQEGGTDGKEEIISSKRMFGNCLPWTAKRLFKIPLSTVALEGEFVCFLLVVSVLVFDARRMLFN
jgi:hypothetical protein